MLRNTMMIAVLLFSANVFADASQLIGKWAAPCSQANPQGTEYSVSVTEFKTDGTAVAVDTLYADSKCAGSATGATPPSVATYTATDTTITLTFKNTQTYVLVIDYKINGNTADLTIKQITVDGVDQKIGPQSVVVTKVP